MHPKDSALSKFTFVIFSDKLLNDVLTTQNVPKTNKPIDEPSSYRPLSLLRVYYKLLERAIYNRIYDAIDRKLPGEQAGFRKNRSCTDQILALSTFIESEFEKKQKTGVALVDLSSLYGTAEQHAVKQANQSSHAWRSR